MNKIQKKIHKLTIMNLEWFKDTQIKDFTYRQHKIIWNEELKKYTNEYIIKTPIQKLWDNYVE